MELLEIEKELTGADGASAMARYDAVLVALDGRIREAQSTGLTPEEYGKVEELRDAAVIARKLLRLTVKDGQTN